MTSQKPSTTTREPANDNPLETALKPLTPREREIVLGILRGESVKGTARRLGVSPKTVELHRTRAFDKTGLRSATEVLLKLGREMPVAIEGSRPLYEPAERRRPDTAIDPNRDPEGGNGNVNLISGLRYTRQVDPDLITVMMAWTAHGEATGYLMLPRSLRLGVDHADYPSTAEPMPLESALAYGLFLSLKSLVQMRLAGDATAWNEDWGNLPGLTEALRVYS